MGASDASFWVSGLDRDELVSYRCRCVDSCAYRVAVSPRTWCAAAEALLQGASRLVEVLEPTLVEEMDEEGW